MLVDFFNIPNRCPTSRWRWSKAWGIAVIELAPAARQSQLRVFDPQMIVVVHQAIGMAQPAQPIDHVGQDGEEWRPIPIVHNNFVPCMAATRRLVYTPADCSRARVYVSHVQF